MALDWLRGLLGSGSKGAEEGSGGMARMLQLTHAGREALARGHAKQALQMLKEKHELVADYWGKDSVFAVTSAVDLADAYRTCDETSEADELLEWALGRYRALEVDDERLLRAELSWAMNAYQSADYTKAEQRFLALIAHYRAAGTDHDLSRAMALDHLAQVYLRQSRTRDAEPLLLDALTIFEREGSDPAAMAICLGLLARVRYQEEGFREAEQLQRRAIRIHESSGDEMNLAKELDHLGASLAMRAQLEHRADLAAEAAKNGERAVAIFEKYLPPNHFSLLGSKQNLAAFRSLSVSIGKWLGDADGMKWPSGDTPSENPEPSISERHPVAIAQSLKRAWERAEQHDYGTAFEMARDTRARAIRYFGADSAPTFEAFSSMIAILRRHCSFLLDEPTGTLSPLGSMMMQMRAHMRRGIVDGEGTPAPAVGPERRAEVERLVREGIKLIAEEWGIAPSGGGNVPRHISCQLRVSCPAGTSPRMCSRSCTTVAGLAIPRTAMPPRWRSRSCSFTGTAPPLKASLMPRGRAPMTHRCATCGKVIALPCSIVMHWYDRWWKQRTGTRPPRLGPGSYRSWRRRSLISTDSFRRRAKKARATASWCRSARCNRCFAPTRLPWRCL